MFNIDFFVLFCSFRSDYEDEATFTMSLRGNFKLMYKGYEYIKRFDNLQGETNWRCCESRWEQCKGKAKTKQIGLKHMVTSYRSHNHSSDEPVNK